MGKLLSAPIWSVFIPRNQSPVPPYAPNELVTIFLFLTFFLTIFDFDTDFFKLTPLAALAAEVAALPHHESWWSSAASQNARSVGSFGT
jgi:hypothetical protein